MTDNIIRVLFIDDDEDDFIITQELLNEIPFGKYMIEWASSYDAALKRINDMAHDVYLVDYRLGENTGVSIIKYAAALGCEAPFIMLTGKGDQKIDIEAMKSGAADYLIKDKIDPFTLERSIRYAIERSQSIQAIKEKELKYRSIFEKTKDTIYIADSQGFFNDLNDSAIELLGYSREELLKMNILDFFNYSKDKDVFEGLLKEKNEIEDFEAVFLTKNQEKIYCILSAVYQAPSKGGQGLYQGIIHDITKRKKAEQELVASEKLLVTGRIAQIIAHEVRNPLTNVNLSLEQLRNEIESEHMDPTGVDMYFDIITRNSERINQLITELLNSSKMAELKFTPYSLNTIIDESLDLAIDRIKLKEITIEKEYLTKGHKVFIDPEKIKIAILNIVLNAVEAMEPKKGILRVRNEAKGNKCYITISDNGGGIHPENMQRLFDPFYSGKAKGMGLGLTTTQNIVLSHKGTINVESEPGKGTTFIISLGTGK